jgi:hypothetical protein
MGYSASGLRATQALSAAGEGELSLLRLLLIQQLLLVADQSSIQLQ